MCSIRKGDLSESVLLCQEGSLQACLWTSLDLWWLFSEPKQRGQGPHLPLCLLHQPGLGFLLPIREPRCVFVSFKADRKAFALALLFSVYLVVTCLSPFPLYVVSQRCLPLLSPNPTLSLVIKIPRSFWRTNHFFLLHDAWPQNSIAFHFFLLSNCNCILIIYYQNKQSWSRKLKEVGNTG